MTKPPKLMDVGPDPASPEIALTELSARDADTIATRLAEMLPWSAYPITAQQLRTALTPTDADRQALAIVRNGVVTGAVVLQPLWLRGPYIQLLGILPEAQCTAIGGTVIGLISDQAQRNGARNVWAACSAFNTRAQRFYARHGFACVATLDDLVVDGIAEQLLRKPLTHRQNGR